jgi:hypothetical protein
MYLQNAGLENVDPHHPPDKEEGDDGYHKVANPLEKGLRFSSVLYASTRAVWGPNEIDEKRQRLLHAGHIVLIRADFEARRAVIRFWTVPMADFWSRNMWSWNSGIASRASPFLGVGAGMVDRNGRGLF